MFHFYHLHKKFPPGLFNCVIMTKHFLSFFLSLFIRRFHAWLKGQGRLFDESSSLTSSAAMTETTISDIQQQVSKTKKRVKTLIRTVELQNRLLATIARQMNLNVEMDDLNVGHWVKPQSTYDEKSEEEKDDTVYHLARL